MSKWLLVSRTRCITMSCFQVPYSHSCRTVTVVVHAFDVARGIILARDFPHAQFRCSFVAHFC